MSLLNKRYDIKQKIQSNYGAFVSNEIDVFEGFDTLHKRPVIIKQFHLPHHDEAKRLAIALWEREIRLTRKAMASSGGKLLLDLIDALVDHQSNSLYIILKKQGKSLEKWSHDDEGLWFLLDSKEENRKSVWEMTRSLSMGIGALHQVKLLHRNLNPSTIFYAEDADRDELKISGFTWSLYLHNINYIPEKLTNRKPSFSLFRSPESLTLQEDTQSQSNLFANDIFSIGMLLCFIFSPDFPEKRILDLQDWNQQYDRILTYFRENTILHEREVNLILNSISLNPMHRPKSISDFKREIQGILGLFDIDEKYVNDRLRVNWYNQTESYFLDDLGNYSSVDIESVLNDPSQWLYDDFQNASLYASGVSEYPLVIINNKDLLFNLRPIFYKNEKRDIIDTLELSIIYTRRRRLILNSIRNKSPLAILRNGLIFASDRFVSMPLSKWRKYYPKAKKELEIRHDILTKEEQFIESLKIMLEAEKRLDTKKMLQFRRVKYSRKPSDKKELAEIRISSDFNKELTGRERRETLDKLFNFRREHSGKIELTMANTPSSSWDRGREWRIININATKLIFNLERPIRGINKELDERGVIRPFEMNLSLSVYRRKERIISKTNENNLIQSALLRPRNNSFYLGLYSQITDTVVSNILNTIPIYCPFYFHCLLNYCLPCYTHRLYLGFMQLDL